jgi:hypothetical protein
MHHHDTSFVTFHAIHNQGREDPVSCHMSFPSPLLSPNEFLDHVRSLGLEAIITPFLHYQDQPLPSSAGGRYDIRATQEWCDRMDTLLVSPILS